MRPASGIWVLAAVCWSGCAVAGDVQYVDMTGVRLGLGPGPGSVSTASEALGLLGSTAGGEVFCGVGAGVSDPRVWRVGAYVPHDERVWVDTKRIIALSRGAAGLYVLGWPGLFRAGHGRVEVVTEVHPLARGEGAPVYPVSSYTPRPEPLTAEYIAGCALAVDPQGVAWTLGDAGVTVWAWVPPELSHRGADSPWHFGYTQMRDCARGALAADPDSGVWFYAPGSGEPSGRLQHLILDGRPPEAQILVDEGEQPRAGLPNVAYPRIAVNSHRQIAVVGQTLGGDLLMDIDVGGVRRDLVPPELSHGRRVTAIDIDDEGTTYMATDGAGVLTYAEGRWAVHQITDHLPTLVGSDLKPVDDILVTEDGTLYAACQCQVVIWRPDEAQ